MKKVLLVTLLLSVSLFEAVAQGFPDFSKLNFGCDGNSITSDQQWSQTVVEQLGFATHHNVAVGSATWACHPDTQDYGSAPADPQVLR
ncbi:MAG: hypothetical protein IJK15_06705 [Bacteroidaceae bacterium]|nr:hypothetical protein [Bacteroidaceae bacterium]